MYEAIEARLKHNIELYAGYPPNTDFDYSELNWALKYPINNIGDPFANKSAMSSHEYEQEVITWFLQLLGSNPQDGWGYTTTGGTEGIIFGMWKARDAYPGGIAYISDQAHYAMKKAACILNMTCIVIKTDSLGQMDYADFERQLNKDKPAIVIATLGTLMTSAKDDVTKIRAITTSKNIPCYIHADAAFDGMVLPFVETEFAHRLDQGIDSISISGHKLIGSPMPSGIVIIKKEHLNSPIHINFIDIFDSTVAGSRSGFASLVLWSAIKKYGIAGYKAFVTDCINRAEKYCKLLNQNGIAAWRFKDAVTIVLEKQSELFIKKWRAPTDEKHTTLMALPKLTEKMIQEIIDDIISTKNHGKLSKINTQSLPIIDNNVKL